MRCNFCETCKMQTKLIPTLCAFSNMLTPSNLVQSNNCPLALGKIISFCAANYLGILIWIILYCSFQCLSIRVFFNYYYYTLGLERLYSANLHLYLLDGNLKPKVSSFVKWLRTLIIYKGWSCKFDHLVN